MNIYDMSGWAFGLSLSNPFEFLRFEYYFGLPKSNFYGVGDMLDVGRAWFEYYSFTLIFSAPPDFWSRPGTRR